MSKCANPSHIQYGVHAADVSISLAFLFPRSLCEIALISGKTSSEVLKV